MNWHIQQGDVLTIPADMLICSANVFLNPLSLREETEAEEVRNMLHAS